MGWTERLGEMLLLRPLKGQRSHEQRDFFLKSRWQDSSNFCSEAWNPDLGSHKHFQFRTLLPYLASFDARFTKPFAISSTASIANLSDGDQKHKECQNTKLVPQHFNAKLNLDTRKTCRNKLQWWRLQEAVAKMNFPPYVTPVDEQGGRISKESRCFRCSYVNTYITEFLSGKRARLWRGRSRVDNNERQVGLMADDLIREFLSNKVWTRVAVLCPPSPYSWDHPSGSARCAACVFATVLPSGDRSVNQMQFNLGQLNKTIEQQVNWTKKFLAKSE